MQEEGGEKQACGRGLWEPQQVKQGDWVLFSSPGSAWAVCAQKACPPQGCSSASMGQGAWQGGGQSAELGVMPSVPGAFPPSQPGRGTGQQRGRGSLRDLGGMPRAGRRPETWWGLGPGLTGNGENGGRLER